LHFDDVEKIVSFVSDDVLQFKMSFSHWSEMETRTAKGGIFVRYKCKQLSDFLHTLVMKFL